jgi:two-component system phosphate regulon response regulator PhoB
VTTIFIVQNEDKDRTALKEALELTGFFVFATANPQDALDMLGTVAPDLVVLDWLLPGIPAETFVKLCQASPRLSNLPVLILSSIPIVAPATVQMVLRKPVSLTELTEKIHDVLRSSKAVPDGDRGIVLAR